MAVALDVAIVPDVAAGGQPRRVAPNFHTFSHRAGRGCSAGQFSGADGTDSDLRLALSATSAGSRSLGKWVYRAQKPRQLNTSHHTW